MSEDQQFDAHIGISPGGSNIHLRRYHHLICSNCADQHIDFKINMKEYEKMEKLFKQLKSIGDE